MNPGCQPGAGEPALHQKLAEKLTGRVCVIGIGNVDLGDDGFGVKLALELSESGCRHIIMAGTTPENWVEYVGGQGFDHVLFLDAVELSAAPGSVALLSTCQLEDRFPQVSTHKLSLSLLAKLLEVWNATVWLLGVQPQSLRQGAALSEPVEKTKDLLREMLVEVLGCNCAQAEKSGV